MKTAETILELLSSKNTVARVKNWLQKNKNKGRSALAQYLCRALNITDHLGKPRMAGVHVALRLLESRGFWKLPQLPRRVRSQPQPRRLNTAVPAPERGRGRDADRSAPPAQTRAGATNAHGSYLGYLASKRSASRTRSSPLVPVPWLGVQFGLGCPAFSLVSVLPSAVSAGGLPLLFDGFAGTIPLYDSPLSCIWVLWLIAFSHRLATFPPQATTGPLGSRTWSFYACLGIYDSAG